MRIYNEVLSIQVIYGASLSESKFSLNGYKNPKYLEINNNEDHVISQVKPIVFYKGMRKLSTGLSNHYAHYNDQAI